MLLAKFNIRFMLVFQNHVRRKQNNPATLSYMVYNLCVNNLSASSNQTSVTENRHCDRGNQLQSQTGATAKVGLIYDVMFISCGHVCGLLWLVQ